jgi:photosynthetic reaction center cytochrome c subunit
MSFALKLSVAGLAAAAAAVFLFGAERPPMNGVQRGYRGTGMEQIYNPRFVAKQAEANQIPGSLPYLGDAGPKAATTYKNVKVLNDVSVGEFTRLMASITTWVSPTQGCAYCHDTNDMASDAVYTKIVARRMIEMVRHVNTDWKPHVAATGVTCYTCHRGQPVPANVWFNDRGPVQAGGLAQTPAGKNHPALSAGATALPFDPYTPFLEQANDIRVVSQTALPTGNRQSIKQTEWTYALMMNFSQALGVNCTYCHNTRSFTDWDQSTPQRETAWHGIRMVRDLNTTYLDPLATTFPKVRLGRLGDAAKVNCATCHNGVYKPLFGAAMAKDFPELVSATR